MLFAKAPITSAALVSAFPGALGIRAQQYRRIVATACRDDVYRDTGIEQQRSMCDPHRSCSRRPRKRSLRARRLKERVTARPFRAVPGTQRAGGQAYQ